MAIYTNLFTPSPERFIRLLFRLPFGTPPVYLNQILNGVAEGQATDRALQSAIRYAHSLPGQPCCEGICRIIQKRPTLANNEEIFSILVWYLNNGPAATDEESDARRTQELVVTAKHMMSKGGFTQIRSGYYDRGLAVEALSAVLWECAPRLEGGIKALRIRIEKESLKSIRCLLTQPVYSVLHHDNQLAAELLKQLVATGGSDLVPLTTYAGILSLCYILHGSPEIGHELLNLLLSAENEEHRLLGAYHIFREAFYDEGLATRAEELVSVSDQHRHIAADAAGNHLPLAAYLEKAEQHLIQYFNDPISEIRSESAECFRGLWNQDLEPHRAMIKAFIYSTAFEENSFSFFHLLKNAHQTTTEEVILAAERVLYLAEQLDGDPSSRRREMHYLDDLLLREYNATECHPDLRERILDILDRMLVLGLYGTDKIIQEHERM